MGTLTLSNLIADEWDVLPEAEQLDPIAAVLDEPYLAKLIQAAMISDNRINGALDLLAYFDAAATSHLEHLVDKGLLDENRPEGERQRVKDDQRYGCAFN